MKYNNYTIDQLLKESEQVQNASNLLGVLNSYLEVMLRLKEITNLSSLELQQHEVSKNFACKINDLAGNY